MAKRKNLFLPQPKWTLMRLLRTLILFGVFAAAGAACWLAYYALTPVEVAPKTRHFKVEQGSSLRSVAEQFEQAGLISDKWSFLVLARLLGNAGDIKAGSYEVGVRVAPHGLLDKIVSGDFPSRNFDSSRAGLSGRSALCSTSIRPCYTTARDFPTRRFWNAWKSRRNSPRGCFSRTPTTLPPVPAT